MSHPKAYDRVPPAALAVDGSGVLRLSGVLDQRTVGRLREESDALLRVESGSGERGPGGASAPLIVDFEGVTSVDSSALALIWHWMRGARSENRRLEMRNLPEQMRSLARTSRMEHFLDG